VTFVRFLHVVALAFFVGGQLLLVVAVVPALRRDADRTAMRTVARRFGVGSLVALAVLFATGAAMADRYGRWGDSVLQVKLMVVVLIGVLIAFHMTAPESRAVAIAVFGASLVALWLGVELAH
jgi:uncharacterized membrane protein